MPVVVAVDGIVELGLIALCLFLILTRRAWVSTFGALLLSLAESIDKAKITIPVPFHKVTLGFGWVADLLRGVNRSALHLLGALIEINQAAAITLWHWTAYLLESTGRVIGDLAESVERELSYLRKWVLLPLIRAALHPLASKVEWLIHRIEHLAAHPATIVRPILRIVDPRVARLEAQVKALAHAVASVGAAIPHPAIHVTAPGIPGIRHGLDAVRDTLGRVVRVLTPAGIVGLVAAGLVALRLGWLKCSNVRRTAEHVCGMDADLLDTLLAGTVAIFGVVSLVEFAEGMQGITTELERGVTGFWKP